MVPWFPIQVKIKLCLSKNTQRNSSGWVQRKTQKTEAQCTWQEVLTRMWSGTEPGWWRSACRWWWRGGRWCCRSDCRSWSGPPTPAGSRLFWCLGGRWSSRSAVGRKRRRGSQNCKKPTFAAFDCLQYDFDILFLLTSFWLTDSFCVFSFVFFLFKHSLKVTKHLWFHEPIRSGAHLCYDFDATASCRS